MVETKEEKRCVKSKKSAAVASQVEQRLWEDDEAGDERRREAEEDAFNSWKTNRRLWRGSEVDKEMALMRERVKMRQMQEKLRLVTQPVIEEDESEEDQRLISEEISGDDSISLTHHQSVHPVENGNRTPETSKPNNHLMNTPPATSSKNVNCRQRTERGMASLEAILKDIIEAVKVAWKLELEKMYFFMTQVCI